LTNFSSHRFDKHYPDSRLTCFIHLPLASGGSYSTARFRG